VAAVVAAVVEIIKYAVPVVLVVQVAMVARATSTSGLTLLDMEAKGAAAATDMAMGVTPVPMELLPMETLTQQVEEQYRALREQVVLLAINITAVPAGGVATVAYLQSRTVIQE
jgi:hypothetical protein